MGERGVLAASRNQTIRAHLDEAIHHLRTHHEERGEAWGTQAALLNAVAALDQLDNAEWYLLRGARMAVLPDPGVDAEHA